MRVARSDVAALYVDTLGPYPALVRDWFDAARDAGSYVGTLPVVAHPPCGPWGRLKHMNRYQDPRHALHAVDVVRRVGGVLEHPRDSALWEAKGLPRPGCLPDAWGGWTLAVEQVRWGHVAQKATWLYIVGCAREDVPPIPGPRAATHWCGGGRRQRGNGSGRQVLVPAGIKVASATQRRRTPPAFAAWLIELAARCVTTR